MLMMYFFIIVLYYIGITESLTVVCFMIFFIFKVEEYIRALSHPPPGSQGVAAIPLGKHVRDDEQVGAFLVYMI